MDEGQIKALLSFTGEHAEELMREAHSVEKYWFHESYKFWKERTDELHKLAVAYEVPLPLHSLQFMFTPHRWGFWRDR